MHSEFTQPFDFNWRMEPSLPWVQYTSEQVTHRVNERCWTQVFYLFLAGAPEDTAGVVTSTPHTVVLWVSCLAAATISVSHRAVVKSHCKGEKFRVIWQTPPRAQNNPATWHLAQNLSSSLPWQTTEISLYVFLSFPVTGLLQMQKASFKDFSNLFLLSILICCLFAGEVLHPYREGLQHCPLEGFVPSAQTPQRWIQVEALCNCTAKTKTIKTKGLIEAQTSQLNRQKASASILHNALAHKAYMELPINADKAALAGAVAAQACSHWFTQSQFCSGKSSRHWYTRMNIENKCVLTTILV